MKITIGGHKRMTLSNQPYEPVQVESVLIIEKEFDDDIDDESIAGYQNKVNRLLEADLEKKIAQALKSQQRTRNKMKAIVRDLD